MRNGSMYAREGGGLCDGITIAVGASSGIVDTVEPQLSREKLNTPGRAMCEANEFGVEGEAGGRKGGRSGDI
jgi:hypothetical protein